MNRDHIAGIGTGVCLGALIIAIFGFITVADEPLNSVLRHMVLLLPPRDRVDTLDFFFFRLVISYLIND